ncbi:MAG: M48 family metallopeptidase [Oscillospiraceae bacterium]|nr:M48 family metallopeptidase [Oscillospiraceae bacterium]
MGQEHVREYLLPRREEAVQSHNNDLSPVQIAYLKQKAAFVLPKRVYHYSKLMGVSPTGIKITAAATRWGSCSPQNSLCFSCRVMLLPEETVDSIIVHELAHIRVKNHSADFYQEVEAYLPDYQDRIAPLRKFRTGHAASTPSISY